MASKAGAKRLSKEYQAIQKAPPPFITAHPSEENILIWYYLIEGPPNTPYEGGQYMGTLVFPSEYPFKPPAIRMMTPSGRFQCNTRLCFSMSDFHPKTWNPSWQVATILTGLLSFMTSDDLTTGAINTTEEKRREYARASWAWNNNCSKFVEQFPQHVLQNTILIRQQETAERQRHRDAHLDKANHESAKTAEFTSTKGSRDQDGAKIRTSLNNWWKWAASGLILAFVIASRFVPV